ncbi:hypothetical protein [Pseudomonas kitaguniensis]|uniref:hypothetical protein n=1 Tax=Pseudomonas kitaguniensis TaxID=2607908 RepID=UPI001561CA91|nr:hypothetical protein [Pseudomonas kitaguniensis]
MAAYLPVSFKRCSALFSAAVSSGVALRVALDVQACEFTLGVVEFKGRYIRLDPEAYFGPQVIGWGRNRAARTDQ